MENNLEQDIEIQLQEELNRLKKAVEYIEQTKTSLTKSQQIYENTQVIFAEMSELHDTFKQMLQNSYSEIEDKTKNTQIAIESKFANKLSSIEQDIQKLKNNKALITEIDSIKGEFIKQQEFLENNFDERILEQNNKIAKLIKRLDSSKTFNYVILVLWIITLFFSIIIWSKF